MFKRIDYVEIVPHDAEISFQFYMDIFNLKIRERVRVDTLHSRK